MNDVKLVLEGLRELRARIATEKWANEEAHKGMVQGFKMACDYVGNGAWMTPPGNVKATYPALANMSREQLIAELECNYHYKLRHLTDENLRGRVQLARVERHD